MLEGMHGVVVEQTAWRKHSKSSQPVIHGRVQRDGGRCVCVCNHRYWGAGEQQGVSSAFSDVPEAFMGY